jgi:hypothetical protein
VDLFLEILGDARFIAVLALGVSAYALVRTLPLQKIQQRLAGLDLEDREQSLLARQRADIRADAQIHADRIYITNAGEGTATDVNIQFLDKPDPLAQNEREEKLPIEVLRPEESCSLIAGFAFGRVPPFKVALTWTDADGTRRHREQVLYGD